MLIKGIGIHCSLQDIDMFKDSISTATPKYVTVNSEKKDCHINRWNLVEQNQLYFFPFIY